MSATEPRELAMTLFPLLMTILLLTLRFYEHRSGEFKDGTYRYVVVWVKKDESPLRFKIHRLAFDLLTVFFGLIFILFAAEYLVR